MTTATFLATLVLLAVLVLTTMVVLLPLATLSATLVMALVVTSVALLTAWPALVAPLARLVILDSLLWEVLVSLTRLDSPAMLCLSLTELLLWLNSPLQALAMAELALLPLLTLSSCLDTLLPI